MGYPKESGSASRKTAALVHFGLLSRDKNTYRVSDLANRIIFGSTEEEKNQAIKEAFRSPKLYRSLRARFKGGAVPALLENILITNEKINPVVAKHVASDFKASAEYARDLVNGVLIDSDEPVKEEIEEKKDVDTPFTSLSPPPFPLPQLKVSPEPQNHKTSNEGSPFVYHLKSGIIISFPQKMQDLILKGKFAGAVESLETVACEETSGDEHGDTAPPK
jgi:hypothetical protein